MHRACTTALAILLASSGLDAQTQPSAAPPSAPPATPASAAPGAPPAPTPAPGAPPAPGASAPLTIVGAAPAATDWIARHDALYKTRDEPAAQKEIHKILTEQLAKDPDSFEANWRLAQFLSFQANGMPDGSDLKGATGKAAWAAGDLAIAAKGDDVRGQYWAAVGIGLYSEGVGILTALSQGLEGKFRGRTQAAIRLDKDYLDGGPVMLWGRFFFKLPWPKRNLDESEKVLRECVKDHPANLRAKLFLADTLGDNDKKDEARKLLKEILDAPMADPADEKRTKEWAKQRNY